MDESISATLRVLTFPDTPHPEPPCTGGYTCSCRRCDMERAERKHAGVRARRVDQPWNAKKAA